MLDKCLISLSVGEWLSTDPGFEAQMVVLSEPEEGSPFRRMPPYKPIARLAAVLCVIWEEILTLVQEMRVRSQGREEPLKKEMSTHSSIIA